MQREAIEFHDSVMGSVTVAGEELTILLAPAYIHRSEGEPARDAGTGWSANVEICIQRATFAEQPPAAPADIWEGSVRAAGQLLENVVPLPFAAGGGVELSITLNNGRVLRVTGRQVELRVVSGYEFVENVPSARHQE